MSLSYSETRAEFLQMKEGIRKIHAKLILQDTAENSKIKDVLKAVKDAVTKAENVEKTYQAALEAHKKSDPSSSNHQSLVTKLENAHKAFANFNADAANIKELYEAKAKPVVRLVFVCSTYSS